METDLVNVRLLLDKADNLQQLSMVKKLIINKKEVNPKRRKRK